MFSLRAAKNSFNPILSIFKVIMLEPHLFLVAGSLSLTLTGLLLILYACSSITAGKFYPGCALLNITGLNFLLAIRFVWNGSVSLIVSEDALTHSFGLMASNCEF